MIKKKHNLGNTPENLLIVKLLKENSDFQIFNFYKNQDDLRKFIKELNKIESKIPKENIEKINNLIQKNIDPRLIIEKILSQSHNQDLVEILISDFERELMAASKSSDKLIIFYRINKNKIVLIHTKIKTSMIPKSRANINYFELKESFWDHKDYLRIVFLQLKKSEILVKIKELSQSKFFDRWLNFRKFVKSYKYNLSLEIEMANRTFIHAPDLKEFYYDLVNNFLKIEKNYIIFNDPTNEFGKFKLLSIEFEDKIYTNENEYRKFISDFMIAQKYPELIDHKKDFKEFISRNANSLLKWYGENPTEKLELLENENEIYSPINEKVIFKKNKFEDIDFILCSGKYKNCTIRFDKRFCEKLENIFLNVNYRVNILHLGIDTEILNPYRLNHLNICNQIELEPDYNVLECEINKLLKSIKDNNLIKIIKFLKYYLFQKFLRNIFMKNALKLILNEINLKCESMEYYDKETEILEFKDKRFYQGKAKEVIKDDLLEISKKYCHFQNKFIIIGIEDKLKINGIDGKYIHSDWMNYFEIELNKFL